jgi:hypothetical protein
VTRSRATRRRVRRRRALFVAGVVALFGALVLSWTIGLFGRGGPSRAAGQTSAGEPTPQTDDAVPARGVVMLGSSPAEAPNETWGIGEVGAFNSGSWTFVHYADGAGWSRVPWRESGGNTPALDTVLKPAGGPLAGRIAAGGAGALLATVTPDAQLARKVVLVRAPGGDFQETTPVSSEGEGALLKPGEDLFSTGRAPLVAALGEGGSKAGALVVPVTGGGSGMEEDGVLHWDGSGWTREQIEVPEASKEHKDFRVLAIGASSPDNAWLLGQLSQQSDPGGVALFRRHLESGEAPTWQPVAPGPPPAEPGDRLSAEGQDFTVAGIGSPPTATAQILTVTDEGVWVDGELGGTPATMFFEPEGEEPGGKGSRGHVLASWCNAAQGASPCTHTLPDALSQGPSRSFAWADPSAGFGQRVITGLGEGVSLRLEGGSFVRVLALGADERSFLDVGGTRGAAFSSPREGWLGNERMPVHLTQNPAPNRLTPYPVPFRHPLLALAPQPGVPVGSLSSQALAVGEQGEVARYTPGQGWQPESLLSAGGRVSRPPLRAVAWPTPARAYAVGQLNSRGDPQMWLWRGETGLWEPDPAAPRNFRGQLLGVAFDPNSSTRGYAVGQQGVLLRFGKSWTQDVLPSEVAGASFTSIAFAGSQAIVAFRDPHPQSGSETAHYTSGLLVNDGSGWHVDQGSVAALAGAIPWAVAGLPDGGTAVSAQRDAEPIVLERDGASSPWQPTAAAYPGGEAPGSLSLFREGGALRAVGSGGIPNTNGVDFSESPPPAGFPPNFVKPYPPAGGYVLRQTAVGWNDEEHDRDEVGAPSGEFKRYDKPYKPDTTSAVLVDSGGASGWAVGGQIDPTGRLETADIARYPADGVPPPGFVATPVPVNPSRATFAIGGGAQCASACADRAGARVGPDVWLTSALAQAGQIAGVRAFIYTGPRVTTGEGLIHPAPVPRERELGRYAELMHTGTLPAFVAPSPTDRGASGECLYEQAFAGFPAPFGTASPAPGLGSAGGSGEACPTGSSGYYALDSSGPGPTVRVIVLDDSAGVGEAQRAWLGSELQGAKSLHIPAIVVGNADISAQISAGDAGAAALAQTLKSGGAAGYFYDSPQRNIAGRVGSTSVPAFGSGTLGYTNSRTAQEQNFTGHAGFLLAEVSSSGTATARLIPNVGELALEAKDGVLLRRSQPALFNGLARRPRAGCLAVGTELNCETSPYIPIPANCVGTACASAILPEYSFTSSRPDIGDFVAPNVASPDPHAVLLGANDKPIHDTASSLFCAYNAGTTVVTISAGGFSASLKVTVQAGSVRRPCGTQPLSELPSQQPAAAPAPPPAPAPAPAAPAPATSPSPAPVPVPPAPATPPAAHTPPPASASFFVPSLAPAPVLAVVPPPVPTPARPTPPSGTSPVTSPVEAPEREEEEEEATESVGNNAVAYRPAEHEPTPLYILGAIALAAFAGASARRRPRRGRREVRIAPATLSGSRAQQRIGAPRRRRPW